MESEDGSLGYCGRCAREVSLVRPWPGFRWLKRLWYAGLLVVLGLMPIILSEITVLLPMAMVFAVAGGPVLSLAAQPITCRTCGAVCGGGGQPPSSNVASLAERRSGKPSKGA